VASEVRLLTPPDGWGRLRIHPSTQRDFLIGSREPHARLADGRTVVWESPVSHAGESVAVDAEMVRTKVPCQVAGLLPGRVHGHIDEWTRLEVLAKLSGVPVLLLLRGVLPPPNGVTSMTFQVEDLIITLGRRPSPRRHGTPISGSSDAAVDGLARLNERSPFSCLGSWLV